jgi:diguanylate cyclase (GGDEF)-like protein
MDTDIGDQTEIRIFGCLSGSFLIDVICQMIWTLIVAMPENFPRWLNWLVNLGDFLATGMIIFFWFIFIYLKMTPHEQRKKIKKSSMILICLPEIFLWVVNLLSLKTGWTFYINENNIYVRGPYYLIQVIVCVFYYASTILPLFRRRTRETYHRSYVKCYIIFTLFPAMGGLLQIWIGTIPFTIMTVTMAIFYLYSSLQKSAINTDALTGLNNRSRMEEVLEQKTARADQVPFWLYIADADSFKQINDTYGHVSGDEALCMISDALKEEGMTFRTFFACRYGGDEFVFMVDENELTSAGLKPEDLGVSLNQNIEVLRQKRQTAYPLHLSIGMTRADTAGTAYRELLHQADDSLYREKEKVHKRENESQPV